MSVPSPTFSISFASLDNSESDLAILLYNGYGQLLQVCFNKKTCAGVTHSGDKKLNGSESATIQFSLLQANVAFIIIAVSPNCQDPRRSYSKLQLFCPELQYQVDLLALASTSPTAVHNFVPLLMQRVPGTVGFQGVPLNAMDNVNGGQSGLDHIAAIADFVLQSLIPKEVWSQVPHSNVELHSLQKNQSTLIQSKNLGTLSFIALGWSPLKDKDGNPVADLDAHAYAIDLDAKPNDPHAKPLVHYFFNNKGSDSEGIRLDEDDRTGDGEEGKDDERIFLRLSRVKKADIIFIVIKIYVDKKKDIMTVPTFKHVKNEFCRAADENENTIVRFALDGESKFADSRNVVMCALIRDKKDSSVWTLKAIGHSLPENCFHSESTVYSELLKLA